MKEAAGNDLESGHCLGRIFEHTDWMREPWQRAQMLALRDGFIAEWKPRGQIELSMIDMMVVAFQQYLYWAEEHNKRARLDPRELSQDYKEWWDRSYKHHYRDGETYKSKYSGQYHDGHWDVPYQKEADAIQQAADLAYRFKREFYTGVRQLRDWRRYISPVIVQNAEQINIASEGGQQVNLQNKQSKKRMKESGSGRTNKQSSKRAIRAKRKQLGEKSPGESIRMKPASESDPVDRASKIDGTRRLRAAK